MRRRRTAARCSTAWAGRCIASAATTTRSKYLEHAKRRINDPEVDLHLGEVLLALDRKNDARDVWTKASERYPDNDELKQRLQKLN